MKSWKPVLTNPTIQIAQQSPTGFKEAFDLGYRLRTKYPTLYDAGTPFITWANLYPRVVATARNFVRGFLGETADTLGTVISVDAKGGSDALFNSLGPGDQCPNYKDSEGATYSMSLLPSLNATGALADKCSCTMGCHISSPNHQTSQRSPQRWSCFH